MNPELKELIALLKYRNSVGEPLQNIVMTRKLFLILLDAALGDSIPIDSQCCRILDEENRV